MRIIKHKLFRLFLLLLSIVLWALCAHFLTGKAFWCGIIPLTVLVSAFFFAVQPREEPDRALSGNARRSLKICNAVFLVLSVLNLLLSPFLSPVLNAVRLTCWILWLCAVSLLASILWDFALRAGEYTLFRGKIILGIQMFSLLSTFLFSREQLILGAQLTLHKCMIILSLALIVTSYCSAKGRMQDTGKKDVSLIFPSGVLVAMFLVTALNIAADRTPMEYHNFTVIETGLYRHSVDCQLDTGEQFFYTSRVYSEGDVDGLYFCDGWFHERYFIMDSE